MNSLSSLVAFVKMLLSEGKKSDAVDHVKSVTGTSLAEAQKFVLDVQYNKPVKMPSSAIKNAYAGKTTWDAPSADPLSDIIKWKKLALQAAPWESEPVAQPSQSESVLSQLVRQYRPTMPAEALHEWAREVIVELQKF